MSDLIEPRHQALLDVLVRHEVRFMLVGGVALQLRGFSGATRDVDVTIATDDLNVGRLSAALEALNARPFLPGDRGTSYHTEHGQLEVMRWTDGVGDYSAWLSAASEFQVAPGLTVKIGSASDLLLAKEEAGRDKDRDALPSIRAELLASGELAEEDVRGPVAEAPTHVAPSADAEQLLGSRPSDRRSRGLWDRGAQLVSEYVERWNVPEGAGPLGPSPKPGSQQASDLESLERQLARLRRLIARDETGR